MKRVWPIWSLIAIALGAIVLIASPLANAPLQTLTGEDNRLSQLRVGYNLVLEAFRPPLTLAADVPIDYHGAPTAWPGVNTFLHQEVEPAKRAQQLKLIKEAGFAWIRQPIPWYDLEVAAKGIFTDTRNNQAVDAWAKYDNILALTEQYSLTLVARLEAPPQWAHQGYADLGTLGPPADRADFADYAGAVAQRYKGRIHFYQIWNEPNIYPEWGNQRANPEDYAKLLCLAHDRIKQIDPSAVVIAAALAPTIAQDGGGYPGGGLNDLVFFERMYAAGAGACFDIAAAQGYGLFSAPEDKRASPLYLNVARHLFMRDIMVRHGDARKPIWLAEVNWNALPADPTGIAGYGSFGLVTRDQQAAYVPRVFERAKREWPWIGGVGVWYFKDASDSAKNQAVYYFRMLEPDFTPLPLYDALKRYLTGSAR